MNKFQELLEQIASMTSDDFKKALGTFTDEQRELVKSLLEKVVDETLIKGESRSLELVEKGGPGSGQKGHKTWGEGTPVYSGPMEGRRSHTLNITHHGGNKYIAEHQDHNGRATESKIRHTPEAQTQIHSGNLHGEAHFEALQHIENHANSLKKKP